MTDKSKDLDMIPAIKPARDEVASYKRTNRAEAPKQSNFNALLVFSLVLMAIMMGVGGYTLYEVQQRLDQSNRILEEANRNVRDLESRLEATGTDVSKTIQDLQAKQTTNFSEIDKLWKIAYRQNRPKLQALEKEIETVVSVNKRLDSNNKTISADLNKVGTRFNDLTNDMTSVKKNLAVENTQMNSRVSKVRSQVQDQADIVERNKRELSSLGKKVNENEESIKVFDRYRQQVNQKLLEMQKMVQSESGPVATN